jgi:hypothetical protein
MYRQFWIETGEHKGSEDVQLVCPGDQKFTPQTQSIS